MHFIPSEPSLKHVGGNTIGGNAQTFYPDLWNWLVGRFCIESVLDVGCGEGHAMREFKRLGCAVHGFDGHPRNATIAQAACHDLTKGPYFVQGGVDLVWSCEVVAQIDAKFVDNVIDTLTQGRFLAMTVELPGQVGHHHVNCQAISYWIEKIIKKGFEVDQKSTEESKRFGHHFWSVTGTIYRRKS